MPKKIEPYQINITPQEARKLTPYLEDLELTKQQRAFAYFYVVTNFSLKESAKLAGYRVNNNKKTSEDANYSAMAFRAKSNTIVQEAIKRVCSNLIKDKTEIEKRLFDIIWKRAFYKINMFINSDGSFKSLDEIPEDWQCVIDGTEIKFYGKDAQEKVIISKLADREKSIERLDKFISFTKDNSSNTQINIISKDAKVQMLNLLHGEDKED